MRVRGAFMATSPQEWDQLKCVLLGRQGWRCCYCEKPLLWKTATFDHLIPRVQGGDDYADNLSLACQRCNSSKGGRSVLQWLDPAGYAEMVRR